MKQEITCIFSLFNMSWSKKRTNELIQFIYERNISVNEFFQIEKMQWEIFKKEFEFSLKEIQDLKKAKESLVSNSFFLEKLLSEGVEILPFTSEEYSKSLKYILAYNETGKQFIELSQESHDVTSGRIIQLPQKDLILTYREDNK